LKLLNTDTRVVLASLLTGVVMGVMALTSLSTAHGQAGATLAQTQAFIDAQAAAPGATLDQTLAAAIAQDLPPELIVKVLSETPPSNLQTDASALINAVVSAFIADGMDPAVIAEALIEGANTDPAVLALALVAAGVDPVTAAAAVIAAASDSLTPAQVQALTDSVLTALNITDPAVVTQVAAAVTQATTVIEEAAAEQQAAQDSAGDPVQDTTQVAVLNPPPLGGGGGVSPN
jgi:hypothetical protein